MFRNVLDYRLAAVAGGIVVMALFFVMGGSFGNPEVIQLDFGMYPELLEGSEVEIDGKVVGKLERTGQATRCGFKVKEGEHVVRVLNAEMPGEEMRIPVRKGEKVRVMLDMVSRYDEGSRAVTTAIGGQF